MTDKTQAIVEQALKLSPTERADVAEQLLASLDEALDSDVERPGKKKYSGGCNKWSVGKSS
jgi:hypothetical protein